MNKALLQELMELSPEERIELAEDLWDSIAQDELPPLTDAQRKKSTGESKNMKETR
jgi:hypothetical protein